MSHEKARLAALPDTIIVDPIEPSMGQIVYITSRVATYSRVVASGVDGIEPGDEVYHRGWGKRIEDPRIGGGSLCRLVCEDDDRSIVLGRVRGGNLTCLEGVSLVLPLQVDGSPTILSPECRSGWEPHVAYHARVVASTSPDFDKGDDVWFICEDDRMVELRHAAGMVWLFMENSMIAARIPQEASKC